MWKGDAEFWETERPLPSVGCVTTLPIDDDAEYEENVIGFVKPAMKGASTSVTE